MYCYNLSPQEEYNSKNRSIKWDNVMT